MTNHIDYPDDVKRLKDEMDFHATIGNHGWVVCSMADGRPLNHTAYPEWTDAARARSKRVDEHTWMILEIQPDGMPLNEAQAVLKYERTLHDAGYRSPSPDWEAGPLASSMPRTKFDQNRMIHQLSTGKKIVEGTNLPNGLVPRAYRKG
jgi:hypothetical protein